jgi:hypothetical protein
MNRTTQFILVAAVVAIFLGLNLTLDYDFPLSEYTSDGLKTPYIQDEPYDGITTGVSQFLWGSRSLDLISQSFVVMAAVICCIALLKNERRNE